VAGLNLDSSQQRGVSKISLWNRGKYETGFHRGRPTFVWVSYGVTPRKRVPWMGNCLNGIYLLPCNL